MRLEDRMYQGTDIEKVIENASHPQWHLDKAHAIYELALRALDDTSLLAPAWSCIGKEIIFVTRQGPPLGLPAATVLIDAGKDTIEKALADEMNSWSMEQQRDFFFGVVEKPDRRALLDRLVSSYGYQPKIRVDENGGVEAL
ncbi:hypothetical protein [Blastopirellula retiformator]|uniref:Uncharacterized protein n=1 Tax=Blastopirellula retiformator TaxID=2527970 RepID=A0A5C5V6R5_9BACT|nr:hypothetical protein [Blastopirellula retiformator]TWT34216.1 hypothetical protein Enr8_16100 [Blastopirellula retiformator]